MDAAAFDRFWRALAAAGRRPTADPAAAIRALPDEGSLPSPWATWTLIGLARHRRRQLWVGEIVRTRLAGDLAAIAGMGALAHPPDVPQSGLVPGLTDWEYYYHGRGCLLTNRLTGEAIDVDFFGDTAEGFDEWFYKLYLDSLKNPEPPEARLLESHPTRDTLGLAFDDLRAVGLLVPYSSEREAPKLTDAVLDRIDAIDAFCERWGRSDGPARAWLGALIGDWPAALAALSDSADAGLREFVAARAAACLQRRSRTLRDRLARDPGDRSAFLALADLKPDDLDDLIRRALAGPLDGLTVKALERIPERDGPSWLPDVRGVLARHSDDASPAAIREIALRFLIRHGATEGEIRRELAKADGLALGEAAVLALEHAPDAALPLIRRALRSRIPHVRATIAAALAVIDQPWSRGEVIAVLRESDDHEATAECRVALRESTDPEARRAAVAWDDAHPREPETGPYFSITEVMLGNCEAFVRHSMETLHDRVLPLRGRVPGSPRAGLWSRMREALGRRSRRRS